jgi:glycosyltransferase involved in cell wall biosynthesis
MPTIGVAIPCYKYHIEKLKRLLDSIETQTRKPDEICVSCSSTDEDIVFEKSYSFPIKVLRWSDRKNASENRNLAMRELKTDIVSFFDADDIMHPCRLQYIDIAFTMFPTINIVVHGHTNKPFINYEDVDIHLNKLVYYTSGCGIAFVEDYDSPLHHSQSSVRRHVLEKVQYREEQQYERCEDSYFCNDVVRLFGETLYIKNPLSLYVPEGQWYLNE